MKTYGLLNDGKKLHYCAFDKSELSKNVISTTKDFTNVKINVVVIGKSGTGDLILKEV